MDEHNYLLKNGDVLKGPLKIATDEITHDLDLINKEYLDDALDNLNIDGDFLPLTGGTMSGDIAFTGTRMLDASNGVSNLTNRASLLLKTSSLPIGISSPSGAAPALSVFGYASGISDSRDEVITLKASGAINCKSHITSEGQFKSTRDSGYSFQVQPGGGDTTALIRFDGSADFKTSRTSGNAFVVNPAGLTADNSKKAFYISATGEVCLGDSTSEAFMATENNHAVTKKYYDTAGKFVNLSGKSIVDPGFLVAAPKSSDSSSTFSFIQINNDEMGLYHVKDPSSDHHAVNMGYANTNYVKISGATMTGGLDIDMSDRDLAALRVKGKFVVKDSTSSIGGNNIFEVTKDHARYHGPVTHDNDIATRKYIEDRPTKIRSGTSTNPTLATGELFWNTSYKVLYIGN